MIDIEKVLDLAFEKFNQRDEAGAYGLALQVQRIIPTHGDALYLLGLIALNRKNYTQSCDFLTVATKLYPQKEAYQMALAESYLGLKNYAQAEKVYHSLPVSNELTLKKAYLKRAQGDLTQSNSLFKSLLKTELKSQALYGLSLLQTGSLKLKFLKQAFEIDKNPIYAEAIVSYYLNKNKISEITKYQDYIKDDFLKAKILVLQKKYEQAETILNNLVKENAYHVEAWVLLGQIHTFLKKDKQAEFDFNQALSLDKNNYFAHKNLAYLLMNEGRLSEALDHYQIICRINPEDTEVLMAMALLTEKVGDYEESLGLCFRLLTLGKKKLSPMIKNNLLKLNQTQPDFAQKFLQGWKKLDPKNKICQKIILTFIPFLICCFSLSLWAQTSADEVSWQIAWENKMAEAGDPVSQYNIAEMFETGNKTPKDISKAIQYYEKSAYQDYLPSVLKLGKLLSQEGKYQDLDKSLQWFKYAAGKGEAQAQFYLAEYYQKQHDFEQAKLYLEQALKQTFPNETDFSAVSPQYAVLLKHLKKHLLKK